MALELLSESLITKNKLDINSLINEKMESKLNIQI